MKDLTVRVVADLVLTCKEGLGNLTFNNWYASTKLMSLLTAMEIPTICTVRYNRIGDTQIKSKYSMSKSERGDFSYAYDDIVGLHCVRWNENSVVTTLSNCIGPYPLDRVERCKEKKKINVNRPNLIKVYNSAMGGVDLLDSAVGIYRTKIKEKKWWWPHFTNTLGVLMGAAWRIYHATNSDSDLVFC